MSHYVTIPTHCEHGDNMRLAMTWPKQRMAENWTEWMRGEYPEPTWSHRIVRCACGYGSEESCLTVN